MGIDHARLQRELDLVREELSGQFPDARPGQILHAINTAAAELVPQATIGTFLPILIRRRAQERLRTRQ
ncbi:three-helix bundle dimerization domain-containing protein [Saccharopolyspora hattusasensis]|uniref:three-helix bundle dimerization domain-containing protein n=1 Tax=Saccharopolyspora hattusasensis TaxID=1128679 RepID=UPI003D99182B